MTWTNAGYAASVDAVQWAKIARSLGELVPSVETRDSFVVSVNTGATLTVNVSAGTVTACGVRSTSDAVIPVAFDVVPTVGATRWDAVVLRRDWSSNTSSVVKVNGTAAAAAPQVLPSGLNNNPGVLHDQVLALVQITNGSATPTLVADMRYSASKVFFARTLAALPPTSAALFGAEFVLLDNTRYRCVQDPSSGSYIWQLLSGTVTDLTGTDVLVAASGWSSTNAATPAVALTTHAVLGDQFIDLDLNVRRTGGALTAQADGNMPDTDIAILKPALWPQQTKNFSIVYCTGAGFDWRQGMCELSTAGLLKLLSGSPSASIVNGGNPDGISLRVSASYARKVS